MTIDAQSADIAQKLAASNRALVNLLEETRAELKAERADHQRTRENHARELAELREHCAALDDENNMMGEHLLRLTKPANDQLAHTSVDGLHCPDGSIIRWGASRG